MAVGSGTAPPSSTLCCNWCSAARLKREYRRQYMPYALCLLLLGGSVHSMMMHPTVTLLWAIHHGFLLLSFALLLWLVFSPLTLLSSTTRVWSTGR